MVIRRLDEDCIRRLSAGEVIQRPVNVVKEVLENALDASAANVTIKVVNGGLNLISIQDDGDGVGPEDLRNICSLHHTSKLKDVADLCHLQTYGFRGEALHSISGVSRISITSKVGSNDNAFIRGSDSTVSMISALFQHGTKVDVFDLFYNLNLRRKVIEKNGVNKEQVLIKELVEKYGCCLSGRVNITLFAGNSLVYSNTKPKLSLIADLWQISTERVHEFALCKPILGVEGVNCWLIRSENSPSTSCISFVNHRLCDIIYYTKFLKKYLADKSSSLGSTYSIFSELLVNPNIADFNTSPTKSTCTIQCHDDILQMVTKRIDQLLLNSSVPTKVVESGPIDSKRRNLEESPFKVRSDASNLSIDHFTKLSHTPSKMSSLYCKQMQASFIGMIDQDRCFAQIEEHLYVFAVAELGRRLVDEELFKSEFELALPLKFLEAQFPSVLQQIQNDAEYYSSRGLKLADDDGLSVDPKVLLVLSNQYDQKSSLVFMLMVSVIQNTPCLFDSDFYEFFLFPILRSVDHYIIMEYARRITDVPFLFKSFERC